MATYGFSTPVGTGYVGYTGIVVSSCGYQPFYGHPSYTEYTHRIEREMYNRQSYDWEESEKFTPEVKPDNPKRNPNGYRQRKLKARLNRLEAS